MSSDINGVHEMSELFYKIHGRYFNYLLNKKNKHRLHMKHKICRSYTRADHMISINPRSKRTIQGTNHHKLSG